MILRRGKEMGIEERSLRNRSITISSLSCAYNSHHGAVINTAHHVVITIGHQNRLLQTLTQSLRIVESRLSKRTILKTDRASNKTAKTKSRSLQTSNTMEATRSKGNQEIFVSPETRVHSVISRVNPLHLGGDT